MKKIFQGTIYIPQIQKKYIYNPDRNKELAGYDTQNNSVFMSCLDQKGWICKLYVGLKDKNVTISYHLPYEYLPDWQLINEFILNFISCSKRKE